MPMSASVFAWLGLPCTCLASLCSSAGELSMVDHVCLPFE
jgi:hypothetical protein